MTIYDPRKVSAEDVGRNFYCREEHIGKVSRAEASLDQLKDLNPNVHVGVAHEHSVEYMYALGHSDRAISSALSCWTTTTITTSFS